MDFIKYQGAGNDFIIINNMDRSVSGFSELAKRLCDRRFGIGADGFIGAQPSQTADVRMVFYNADGSEAGMCGNGIRCFAKFVTDQGIVTGNPFTVETGDGIKVLDVLEKGYDLSRFRVDMGAIPSFTEVTVPMDSGGTGSDDGVKEMRGLFTHFGVPHAVFIQEDPDADMMKLDQAAYRYGRDLEYSPVFAPARTNVNFIRRMEDNHILCSTWERGAGKTLACGTGACSSAAAAQAYLNCGDAVRVTMPGGEVTVSFVHGRVYMEGNAARTFCGSVEL